jgi:hypothetical protein
MSESGHAGRADLMSQPMVTLDYLDPLDIQCLFGASSETDMYRAFLPYRFG